MLGPVEGQGLGGVVDGVDAMGGDEEEARLRLAHGLGALQGDAPGSAIATTVPATLPYNLSDAKPGTYDAAFANMLKGYDDSMLGDPGQEADDGDDGFYEGEGEGAGVGGGDIGGINLVGLENFYGDEDEEADDAVEGEKGKGLGGGVGADEAVAEAQLGPRLVEVVGDGNDPPGECTAWWWT